MTVTQSGVESGGRAAQFEPIIRRSSPQERVIAWGLTAVGLLGLAIGLAIMASGQYRGMLACFAAAALCLLMGYLTLRPRTVFDRSGIHSRTLLRSYDIAWPDSRSDFVVGRYAHSIRRHVSSGAPSVYAKVRSNGDVVVCCTDWSRDTLVGSICDNTLEEIWNSKKLYDFRCMQLKTKGAHHALCATCEIPLKDTSEDNLDDFPVEKLHYWGEGDGKKNVSK